MVDEALNPDPGPDWRSFLAEGRGLRLSGLLAVVVLHAGGNYAVVTLAPAIVAEVGGGALIGALTALFNITTILAAAAVGPLAGRFGPGPLLWAMTAACVLGALLSAGASSMTMVALGRGIAGFGGGGLLALAYVAMRSETSAAAFPKLSALTGAFWIGAAFTGPLLGGLLADLVGWRPAFVLVGGLSLAYTLANRRIIAGTEVERVSEAFPVTAFAAFGLGVALISFAPLFGAGAGLAMAAAGFGSLLSAVLRERRRAPRMFPTNAFRMATEQGGALAAKTMLGASAMSVLVFGPLLLIQVHGRSATFAGTFVLIETLSWSVGSFIAASVRAGRFLAMLGPLLSVAGLAGCAVFLVGGQLVGAGLAIATCGLGLGLAWPFLGARIIAGDTGEERAKTMAMISSVETLGFAVGGAVVGLAGSLAVDGALEGAGAVSRAAETGILVSIPLALVGAWLSFNALRR